MYIVNNYTLAVIFCVVTMLCWGSWGNMQKLASKTWRYEYFYWDYVIGVLLFSILVGLHARQHRKRGTQLSARSGSGRPEQPRQRLSGRRRVQRRQHPAGGRHRDQRAVGSLSGGHRAGARAGRAGQLLRRGERPASVYPPRRRADRRGDRAQRHGVPENAERYAESTGQGDRHLDRGRNHHGVLLPLRRGLDGPDRLRPSGRRQADSLHGSLRIRSRSVRQQFHFQHDRHEKTGRGVLRSESEAISGARQART